MCSHIFHYLFGFRSASRKNNEDIEHALEVAERRKSKRDYDSTYLGIIHMYLPEDKIPEILSQAQTDLYDEIIQEFSLEKMKTN